VPYSNTVTLLDTEGGTNPTTPVVARLWKLESDIWGYHAWDQEQEAIGTNPPASPPLDVRIDESNPAGFAFASAATYTNKPVGLTLQDASRVVATGALGHPGKNETGWLFRSGSYQTALPATNPIDLIAARDDIVAADLAALFPTAPVTVDTNTQITQITPTLADPTGTLGGGIDVEMQGTWTGGLTFQYSGRFVPSPGTDIAEPNQESVIVEFLNENHSFLGGANPSNEGDLWAALDDYTTNTLLPALRSNIESHVAKRIAGAVGINVAGALPADVILSVRSVVAKSQQLSIRGVLGSFGNVAPKLRGSSGGGGGGGGPRISCPFVAVGTLPAALEVLRAVRDTTLATSESGRAAIAAYYRFGGEVSALLARDPRLAGRTAELTREVTATLRRGRAVDPAQRRRGERLLREIAALGSPELRVTIAAALDGGVTGLL
jgi:hypothetical protein